MAQAELSPFFGDRPVAPTRRGLGRISAHRVFETIGNTLFGLFVFLIGFDISEPSPYDLLALPVVILWLALGVRMPRGAVLFIALLLIYCLGISLATMPYFDRPDSVRWAVISFYLAITAVFFAMFFSEKSERRVELALSAFVASSLASAVVGIMGYFGIVFPPSDRAIGTFDDPNVFGSFAILAVLFLVHGLLTGERRWPLFSLAILPLLLTGIFLSFSRGSWAAMLIGITALLITTFVTSASWRVRRRITILTLVGLIVSAGLIVGLLMQEEVRSMFETRAQVTQNYDEGETGRFGNQLRAIPALIERPNGFGPLRYRLFFGFEPHNTYLDSFASGGWLGGFAFLGLVITTTYVALRLALRPSPYRRYAQILFATHLTFVLQSFQIDLDHWRHVYLVWGAIWGLEAARLRWLAGQNQRHQEVRSGWGSSLTNG